MLAYANISTIYYCREWELMSADAENCNISAAVCKRKKVFLAASAGVFMRGVSCADVNPFKSGQVLDICHV